MEIKYKGKTHRLRSCLTYPLVLGSDWPGFNELLGQWVEICSQLVGTCDVCAVSVNLLMYPECQLLNQPAIPRPPLCPLPLMEVPFEHIGTDLIRPFHQSALGYHFVLVLVDNVKWYPEAVQLCSISAKNVTLFQVTLHIVHVSHTKRTA